MALRGHEHTIVQEGQAELEQQWAAFAKERYAEAKAKAEEALKLAR